MSAPWAPRTWRSTASVSGRSSSVPPHTPDGARTPRGKPTARRHGCAVSPRRAYERSARGSSEASTARPRTASPPGAVRRAGGRYPQVPVASRQHEKERRRQERLEREQAEAASAARIKRLQFVFGGVLVVAIVAGVVAVAAGALGGGKGGSDSAKS